MTTLLEAVLPFSARCCDQAYDDRSDYSRHMRKAHRGSVEGSELRNLDGRTGWGASDVKGPKPLTAAEREWLGVTVTTTAGRIQGESNALTTTGQVWSVSAQAKHLWLVATVDGANVLVEAHVDSLTKTDGRT